MTTPQRPPRTTLFILTLVSMATLLCAACGQNPALPGENNASPIPDAQTQPDTDPQPPWTITLNAPDTIGPCDTLEVSATLSDDAPNNAQWSIAGHPLLALQRIDDTRVSLRTPVVNLNTELHTTPTLTHTAGLQTNTTATVTLTAPPPPTGMTEGLAPDCAPFEHGVASGDPHPNSLILWTRLTPQDPTTTQNVSWELASDIHFQNTVQSGQASATPERDHTVHVTVEDLPAGQTFYYRFTAPDGTHSTTGRTRTTPTGAVTNARFAVGSCSSIWSGHFNAYARIAQRDDLDLMIHLGDFVYDFVDAEEEVRVPDPYPVDPENPEQWRQRFRYYLMDPSLRIARAAHPWLVIWDNHDADVKPSEAPQQTTRVFRDYVPMRQPNPDNHRIAYRSLQYGDLVHLIIFDALLHRTGDTPETQDMLGQTQWQWLENELNNSQAAWRVLGSQKLTSTLVVPAVGLSEPSPWDQYPNSRARLFELLRNHNDNILLSGDLHFSIAADVVLDPINPDAPYDPNTSADSIGVEILATGITRGNFDETICRGPCSETTTGLIEDIGTQLGVQNPHVAFLELIQHGYGVVDITPQRATAQFWYSDILELTQTETLGGELTVERGANKWTR